MKKKNLMRLSAGVAGAIFGLLPMAGHAEQTATLPNGANLSVQLDSPSGTSNCEEFNVPPGATGIDIPVEGKACVGEGTPNIGLIVVVDNSGSTTWTEGGSCGMVLDCEKQGVAALLDHADSVAEFSVVSFGSYAATGDMQSAAGDQLVTTSSVDAKTVSDSIDDYGMNEFTVKDSGGGTNYKAALAAATTAAQGMSSGLTKIVVFLSDGLNTYGSFANELSELQSHVDAIYPIAVGSDADCTGGDGGSLSDMGSCQHVVNPEDLANALPNVLAAALESVNVSMGSISTVPAPPADGPVCADFSGTIPGLAPGAYSDICVAATGSDSKGTASVQECVDSIQLLQLTASSETNSDETANIVKAEIVGGDGCSSEPRAINFVVSGQNSTSGSVSTLPNKEVEFTYPVSQSCDGPGGEDTITVSTDIGGETASVEMKKTWTGDSTPPDVSCESVNGKLQVNADDQCSLTMTVTDADGHVYSDIQPGDTIQYGQYQTSRMPHKQVKMNGWPADWVLVGHGNLTVTAVDAAGNESSATCPSTDRYSVRRR